METFFAGVAVGVLALFGLLLIGVVLFMTRDFGDDDDDSDSDDNDAALGV